MSLPGSGPWCMIRASVTPDNCLCITGGLYHPLLAEGDAVARPISGLEVPSEEKWELERRVAASTTPGRDCIRAHIVLMGSEGVGQQEVASRLGVSAPSVTKWSQRFDRDLRTFKVSRPLRRAFTGKQTQLSGTTLAGAAPPVAALREQLWALPPRVEGKCPGRRRFHAGRTPSSRRVASLGCSREPSNDCDRGECSGMGTLRTAAAPTHAIPDMHEQCGLLSTNGN